MQTNNIPANTAVVVLGQDIHPPLKEIAAHDPFCQVSRIRIHTLKVPELYYFENS